MNTKVTVLSISLLLTIPLVADNKIVAQKDVPASIALDKLIQNPREELVSLSKVAEGSTLGQNTKKKIEDKHKSIVQELQALNADFEKATAEYSAKMPAMKDQTARANAEKDLNAKKRNLEATAQDRDAELKQFYMEQTEIVLKETIDAIGTHAKAKGDVGSVKDIDTGRVIWVAENVDLTNEYLGAVEKEYSNKLNVAKNSKTPATKTAGKLS
ncbi:MAG: OmpH family outer membrane protein [Candidatus Dependentiae bacterium]